jgi:hypothetical protein
MLPCHIKVIKNQFQGYSAYHHRVVIEDENSHKTVFTASCKIATKKFNKRDVLPAGFQEPE